MIKLFFLFFKTGSSALADLGLSMSVVPTLPIRCDSLRYNAIFKNHPSHVYSKSGRYDDLRFNDFYYRHTVCALLAEQTLKKILGQVKWLSKVQVFVAKHDSLTLILRVPHC